MDEKRQKLVFSTIYWAVGLALILILPQIWLQAQVQEIHYARFKRLLREGRILQVRLGPERIQGVYLDGPEGLAAKVRSRLAEEGAAPAGGRVSLQALRHRAAELAGGEGLAVLFETVRVEDPGLVAALDAAGTDYAGERESTLGRLFWSTLLPVLFWVGLWFLLVRSMGRPGAGLLSFGRTKARISPERSTGVGFDDVAGCEEAKEELREVVQFLREPDRYRRLGATIPKGVLLVGPPGTGKTLLARALAGEARVPFFSISGSEFVEMFVGVGAARVRDLFDQAKKSAPCIVFVDELDAIGKFRGGGAVPGGNEEREQTLNQLLVEMDGFEPNQGVILLAATNRPEVLDPALLRPGRFDRQVVLDAPDVRGRKAILEVHARGKPLAADVDLGAIALRTPGLAGADLANIMNEAALLAARRGGREIRQADLEEAVEKVLAGPEKKSRRLGDEERRRVAVHEAGHALVAAHCPGAPPVSKISIVPRGRAALGYTLQLPEEERYLVTRAELLDRVCVALGGRAAEILAYGEPSTGAQNDLEHATDMVRALVTRFGMSEKIGPVALARETSPFLRVPGAPPAEQMSPALAEEVDRELRAILDEQARRAGRILEAHRDALDRVVAGLVEREVMSAEEFRHLVEGEEGPPGRTASEG
ncbi:ATP-dependent zinc metalloprotease FtsH [Dissulfurirhabdus thermomarina]|uniref:ATP-dependent zinc metalloprotease FtsH n=1 Tax=Dissulfurirhabdus thermomarina TaxID=1765737 RepID=A0A6N9TNY1_DISTH|nr:ATP-dependent zinc metalloprotease FtsH [Dissulfurirhabdus thermomarina]NDY41803.1 ATP-dependent zinc metalloprotease FtsH [Dissulfurirhabdus thermomarina]NMX24056.1 ATP-dependent zinc metalloprotease FtsH [Dissulfurirhabdus thermomarina]